MFPMYKYGIWMHDHLLMQLIFLSLFHYRHIFAFFQFLLRETIYINFFLVELPLCNLLRLVLLINNVYLFYTEWNEFRLKLLFLPHVFNSYVSLTLSNPAIYPMISNEYQLYYLPNRLFSFKYSMLNVSVFLHPYYRQNQ